MIDYRTAILESLKEFVQLPHQTLELLHEMESDGKNPRSIDYIKNDCKKMYKDYHAQWKVWENTIKSGCPVMAQEDRLRFMSNWDQLEAKLKTNLEALRAFFNE